MSRLLTLLALYQHGYEVGRHVLVPSGIKESVKLKGVPRPREVRVLRTGEPVEFRFEGSGTGGAVSWELPAASRSGLLDAVVVTLP